MLNKSQVFLIDGHALCYRAFFAVKDLRNSQGQPTNAIFGFVNILKKIQKNFQPSYMAVCFDAKGPTRRHLEYSAYKEHRPSMPEDLRSQIPLIQQVLAGYRIPVFEQEGIEADDLLASLAWKFSKEAEVIIVSDDKDLYQLIDDAIKVYSPRQDRLMAASDTMERFGVPPHHIVDYLAIVGDASDNIPGIRGIGPVGAKQLISKYGSLENIVAHQDELKPQMRAKIIENQSNGFLSHQLATLDKNIPLSVELADIQVLPPDQKKLLDLFSLFEFQKLMNDCSSQTKKPEAPKPLMVFPGSEEDFLQYLLETQKCSIVFEASEPDSLSFILASNQGVCHLSVTQMSIIEKILASKDIVKIVFQIKPLLKWASQNHIQIQGECFDVHLAGYLLMSGRGAFDLRALSWEFLGETFEEDQMNIAQATTILALYEPLKQALQENQMQTLMSDIELPLMNVLVEMERQGVRMDMGVLETLNQETSQTLQTLMSQIDQMSPETFNLNSPKQLSHILFEKMGLKAGRKTKTGYSTDEETLTQLISQHPMIPLILEYRQIAKLRSTYIEAFPKWIHPQTKNIHCSFDSTGAETGRLSSNHPNLQNIPIRTALGKEIRKAFTASSDQHLLLSVDYSQIELRVLAHLAQEENMKKAFHQKEDIHCWTASLMFDVEPHQVDETMRYRAKRINFGIIYGMSPFGLAKDLGVSHREASDFIDLYFARFPGIRQFMDQQMAEAKQWGYVKTLFHRRRYLPDIHSKNPMVRQMAERQAVNTPVQGTAADMMKLTMVQLADKLKKTSLSAKMIITVHDELVFDVFKNDLLALANITKQTMEQVCFLSVPLEVSLKAGFHWADMQTLTDEDIQKTTY